mmetsp:Transcript_7777/g.22888  ORF Transcript_7777/g.22888 Transcript_7777/m.22888 type:complete len:178 (-) Transcript_7777:304-837(-)
MSRLKMHSLLFSTTHYRFWMIRFTRIGLAKAATKEGETGLHLVAISGKAGIARALLDAGASPNVRTTFDGGLRMHPLSWNVYAGHHEIVDMLLNGGARVNDDFDLRPDSDEKVTVLDIAERLSSAAGSNDGGEGKAESDEKPTPFDITWELLLKRGAKPYKELHQSVEEGKGGNEEL